MLKSLLTNSNFAIIRRQLSTKIENEVILKKDGPIAILGLNRIARKNALSKGFLVNISRAIEEVAGSNDVRVLIVRSLVPGVFCAGADLKERLSLTPTEVQWFVSKLSDTFKTLEDIDIPTIAAIEGVAVGGGLELALSCDMRTATVCSKIGLVETKLGIIPGAGGTQRLPRLINPAIAKELILTGRILNGKEAQAYGITNRVVEQNVSKDAAFSEAMGIANSILETGPIAAKLAKKAIDRGLQVDLTTGLEIEKAYYAQTIPTNDRLEGLASVAEKRKPLFKGN